MGLNRRAAIRAAYAFAMGLALAVSAASSAAGSSTVVGLNFVGSIDNLNTQWSSGLPSPSNSMSIGDTVSGQFTYVLGQPGSMSSSSPLTWTYNFTGSAGVTTGLTADTFQVSNSSGASLYTDSFYKNTVTGNNLYEVILQYRPTSQGGTLMTVESATLKVAVGQPAFVLTFADPTNQYTYGKSDSLTGTYGVANSLYSATTLPLPDQATLTDFYKVSKTTPGMVTYGDATFFSGPVTILYPLGASIPEPSALVMGLMAVAIGGGGFWMSRRKRLSRVSA
jgi:hypothetical protein